jgi:hypothetical protein
MALSQSSPICVRPDKVDHVTDSQQIIFHLGHSDHDDPRLLWFAIVTWTQRQTFISPALHCGDLSRNSFASCFSPLTQDRSGCFSSCVERVSMAPWELRHVFDYILTSPTQTPVPAFYWLLNFKCHTSHRILSSARSRRALQIQGWR